ncbi:MAG: hypothetical protein WKF75_18740 [Singulisphaera sp.]
MGVKIDVGDMNIGKDHGADCGRARGGAVLKKGPTARVDNYSGYNAIDPADRSGLREWSVACEFMGRHGARRPDFDVRAALVQRYQV